MPYVGEKRVVSFDAETAVDALVDAVGDDLRAVAEYDRDDVNVVFAAELIVGAFGGVEPVEEFANDFHDHATHDFYEREIFDDLFPMTGDARAFITTMDDLLAVRYLTATEGLFVAATPGASLDAILDALDDVVE